MRQRGRPPLHGWEFAFLRSVLATPDPIAVLSGHLERLYWLADGRRLFSSELGLAPLPDRGGPARYLLSMEGLRADFDASEQSLVWTRNGGGVFWARLDSLEEHSRVPQGRQTLVLELSGNGEMDRVSGSGRRGLRTC